MVNTVEAPARLALPYGLFSTFNFRPESDHWRMGLQWEGLACEAALGIGDQCAPVGGVSEVQTVTITGTPTGGTFRLTFDGQQTATIAYNAAAAAVQTALQALSTVGAGNALVTGGPGPGTPYVVTFAGALANQNVAQMTASSALTGGTTPAVGVATTTPGAPNQVIGLPKDLDEKPAWGEASSAFTVYGHYHCSAIGVPFDWAQEQANAHLKAREEARVEQAVWTGDLGNTPNLATSVAPGNVNSVAASLRRGIADLDQRLARLYGSLGVLHMTRETALLAIAKGVLDTGHGRLTTELGTPVAAGAGYPGTGPNNVAAAANRAWAFGTGALIGYRSDIETSSNRPGDLLDRSKNDLYAIAERSYTIGWEDCGVVAALIDLTSAD